MFRSEAGKSYFSGAPLKLHRLDEQAGSGRLGPVAGPVDRNQGDRVFATPGSVKDGSI